VVCVGLFVLLGSGLNLTEIVLESSARLIHKYHTRQPGPKTGKELKWMSFVTYLARSLFIVDISWGSFYCNILLAHQLMISGKIISYAV
jgi:hypothetical protein